MNFYRVDSTRLTLREYWNWKPGIPFVLLSLMKLLGIRIRSPLACARPEALLQVEPVDLSESHRMALDPLIDQCRDFGFAFHFFYTVPTRGPASGIAAVLTGADQLTLALLVHSEPKNARRPSLPSFIFYSCHADGRILATSGGMPGLIGVPPEFQVVRLRYGSLYQTWNRHSERIRAELAGPIPFQRDNVADSLLGIVQRAFDYNIERGVWVPVLEAELQ